jgi:hypothetical protein
LPVKATIPQAEALQERDKPQDLVRLAAVAEQDGEVALIAEAEVAVEGLRRVEEAGGDARAVEGRRDLPGDVGDLPTPLKTSLPPAAIVASTARAVPMNSAPRPLEVSSRASHSMRMHCLALASAVFGAMAINAVVVGFRLGLSQREVPGKLAEPSDHSTPFAP